MKDIAALGKQARELLKQWRALKKEALVLTNEKMVIQFDIAEIAEKLHLVVSTYSNDIATAKDKDTGKPKYSNESARKAALAQALENDKAYVELCELHTSARKTLGKKEAEESECFMEIKAHDYLMGIVKTEMDAIASNPRITIRYAR